MDWWKKSKSLITSPYRSFSSRHQNRLCSGGAGNRAERLAKRYLLDQGLCFYCANERLGKDEIDLIFRDNQCWVLVEVRYRSSAYAGSGLDSIEGKKECYLRRSARKFLQHPLYLEDPAGLRVDVVSVSGNLLDVNINWAANAILFDDLSF